MPILEAAILAAIVAMGALSFFREYFNGDPPFWARSLLAAVALIALGGLLVGHDRGGLWLMTVLLLVVVCLLASLCSLLFSMCGSRASRPAPGVRKPASNREVRPDKQG